VNHRAVVGLPTAAHPFSSLNNIIRSPIMGIQHKRKDLRTAAKRRRKKAKHTSRMVKKSKK
jgi:hypothetical protein